MPNGEKMSLGSLKAEPPIPGALVDAEDPPQDVVVLGQPPSRRNSAPPILTLADLIAASRAAGSPLHLFDMVQRCTRPLASRTATVLFWIGWVCGIAAATYDLRADLRDTRESGAKEPWETITLALLYLLYIVLFAVWIAAPRFVRWALVHRGVEEALGQLADREVVWTVLQSRRWALLTRVVHLISAVLPLATVVGNVLRVIEFGFTSLIIVIVDVVLHLSLYTSILIVFLHFAMTSVLSIEIWRSIEDNPRLVQDLTLLARLVRRSANRVAPLFASVLILFMVVFLMVFTLAAASGLDNSARNRPLFVYVVVPLCLVGVFAILILPAILNSKITALLVEVVLRTPAEGGLQRLVVVQHAQALQESALWSIYGLTVSNTRLARLLGTLTSLIAFSYTRLAS